MKFAICQELFVDWEWERQCRFSAELGYKGLEVAPFTLAPRISDVSKATRQSMRKVAADCGLEIIGLHWLLAKTEGLHATTANAAMRKTTADYLVELGDACADMGGTLMVFGSPQQRNVEAEMSREQAYANAAEVFRAAMPRLADRGVKICMEPLTTKETNFVNTCADAMELIERVDHPNFCLHQDVKAMLGAESESIPALIEKFAPHVGHFHVNDTNLLGPGMGDTDFAPIFDALLKTKYDGWVSVEVFDYSPGAEKISRDSIRYMREVLAQIARWTSQSHRARKKIQKKFDALRAPFLSCDRSIAARSALRIIAIRKLHSMKKHREIQGEMHHRYRARIAALHRARRERAHTTAQRAR